MAVYIKAQTKVELEKELAYLKTEGLQEINRKIKEAREFGDLSENAEYHIARAEKGKMEERIALLEKTIPECVVYERKGSYDKVEVGCVVTLLNVDTDAKKKYEIVGEYDYALDQNPPHVTSESPLAKALLGLAVDDEVDFEHNGNVITYAVLEIE